MKLFSITTSNLLVAILLFAKNSGMFSIQIMHAYKRINLFAVSSPQNLLPTADEDARFKRIVSLGDSVEIKCYRICGLRVNSTTLMVLDRWHLQPAINGSATFINQDQTRFLEEFEEKYDVTLILNRSDYQAGCSGEFIEYSLRISNINDKVHGLQVRCAARLLITDSQLLETLDDTWEASHVTEILIGKYKNHCIV